MSHFLHSGGADLLVGLAGIAGFLVAGLIMARRIRSGRIQITAVPPPGVSEVELAVEMFYRVAAVKPHDVWLLAPRSNVRFRLTRDRGCYVVERITPHVWPFGASMPVRVDAIVLRPNKRYLTRYTLDTATTQGGEIPLTVSLSPAMLAELEAELYAQTAMTVADIEEWTRCVDEAQPE